MFETLCCSHKYSKSPPSVFHFTSWLRWLTKHFNQPGATDHAGVLTQEEVLYKIEEKKTTTEGSKATSDETIPPLVGTPLKERKIWWEIDADWRPTALEMANGHFHSTKKTKWWMVTSTPQKKKKKMVEVQTKWLMVDSTAHREPQKTRLKRSAVLQAPVSGGRWEGGGPFILTFSTLFCL